MIAESKTRLSNDPRSQFFTLLLGKDHCMRVALNIAATSKLPQDFEYARTNLNDDTKPHWAKGYIRRKDDKKLAAMITAMSQFDLEQQQGTPPPVDEEEQGNVTPNAGNPASARGCPSAGQNILVPGSKINLLKVRNKCIRPTMVVIHWAGGGWGTPESTINALNSNGYSCQFAIGKTRQLQIQYLFSDVVEKAVCVGGYGNTISIEISGQWFDDVFENKNNSNYNELMGANGLGGSTKQALNVTCWVLKQYNIPITQVFGHNELNNGQTVNGVRTDVKSDPGQKYINKFRQRLTKDCKI